MKFPIKLDKRQYPLDVVHVDKPLHFLGTVSQFAQPPVCLRCSDLTGLFSSPHGEIEILVEQVLGTFDLERCRGKASGDQVAGGFKDLASELRYKRGRADCRH